MGSIGDAFTPTVPSVGSSGTQYAVDINAALLELITRVSSPVPFSALSGSTLDLNNIPAIDFQYLGLYEQPSSPGVSPVGRLERYQNNLYWVGQSGAVQLTNGASINISSAGGFGGDYISAAALATYVDAQTRYEFYDNTAGTVWAFLRARGIDVGGTAGSTNFVRIDTGGTANYTFRLPATLPGANRSVLVISNTGQVEDNSATDTISNTVHLAANVDIVQSGTGKIQHGDRTLYCAPILTVSTGTWAELFADSYQSTVAGIGRFKVMGLQSNWRIKSVKVWMNKLTVGATTVNLQRYVAGGASLLATANTTTSGVTSVTATAGSPHTMTTGDVIIVEVQTAANNDAVYGIEITYDVPA